MKVYVDELPKNCEECPCCSSDQYYNYMWGYYTDTKMPYFDECNLKDYSKVCCEFKNKDEYKKYLDSFPKNNKEQYKTCPLQSLADYTKQVRKDVCEDFKSRFLVTCQIEKGCDNATFSLGTLDRILDQIQGE